MSSIKKRFSVGWMGGITLGLLCGMTTVLAGSVGGSFNTGNTLTAAQMTGIQDAVNDNNTRIGNIIGNTQAGALKTEVDKIGGIQTDVNNLKGNLANGACVVGALDDVGGMVRVGSLCIDKFQATADFTGCSPGGITGCGSVVAASKAGTPAVGMSWAQAQRACINAGKRLLTPGEWIAGFLAGAFTATTDSFDFVDAFLPVTSVVAGVPPRAQAGYVGKFSGSNPSGEIHVLVNVNYNDLVGSFSTFSWHFRCGR